MVPVDLLERWIGSCRTHSWTMTWSPRQAGIGLSLARRDAFRLRWRSSGRPAHPEEVLFGIDLIRVVDVNEAALRMVGADDKSQVLSRSLGAGVQLTELDAYKDQMVAAWEGRSSSGSGLSYSK